MKTVSVRLEAERMSPLAFAGWRHLLGLSLRELAGLLRVGERTVRAWESGRDPIPYRVPSELEELRERHDEIVARFLHEGSVRLPYAKDSLAYRDFPRGFYIGALARALSVDASLRASYSDSA